MRPRSTLILAGLTATLLLGLAVSSASANRLSVTNTRFRITWREIEFHDLPESFRVLCPLTLEGSFHSATVRKVRGALIGAITRGIVNGSQPPCTGGRATVLQETLPWHLTYEDFRGALPAINAIDLLLRRYAFRVEVTVLGVNVACLYKDRGRAEENLVAELIRNTATSATTIFGLQPGGGRYAGLLSGGFGCPQQGFVDNEGEFYVLGTLNRISVTLI
jgi:hypothetical protein